MAVERCIQEGNSCKIAKSDIKNAFRHLGIRVADFSLLVMCAQNPANQQWCWFMDKALPFGSSISCKLFQEFSDCVAHLVKFQAKKVTINYLDDYLFCSYLQQDCNRQVRIFLAICGQINFPVSLEKTFWATTVLTFLGLLLNTIDQTVSIPVEKLEKTIQALQLLYSKRKVTVLQLQQLTGRLNFLCKAIVPGRAFTRRFYAHFNSKMLPHYHINVTKEMCCDMRMWMEFLRHPSAYCRPFLDFTRDLHAEEVNMYSDASGNFKLGFAAFCQNSWLAGFWDETFMRQNKPSIEFLELFALAAGVLFWIHRFKNRQIYLFTDNQTVQSVVNNNTSSCKNCMVLVRLIVLESLKNNVRVFAKYMKSKDNEMADALSRGQMERFWRKAPETMEKFPSKLPEVLWPIDKFWIK